MPLTTQKLHYFTKLPHALPNNEPYYYLSQEQRSICEHLDALHSCVPHLPCWVPHRIVSNALGYGEMGIHNALQRSDFDQPYVWATEFENVHSTWNFDEPQIIVDGIQYNGSEDYYHSQKPFPFDSQLWHRQRDDVMKTAVYHKFTTSTLLQDLLLSTHNHPLLSIKRDGYWGVFPSGEGENKLAVLLMELRTTLRKSKSQHK